MCQPLLPRCQIKAGTRKRRKNKGRHGLDTWKDYMKDKKKPSSHTDLNEFLTCSKLKILGPKPVKLDGPMGMKTVRLVGAAHTHTHTHDGTV